MPTLADMKSRIKAEIARDDLDTAIASEITSAIKAYRARRFWFSEKRDTLSFSTIAGLSDYDAEDDPMLADIVEVDDVSIGAPGTFRMLWAVDPMRIAVLLGSSPTNTASPTMYAMYGQSLRFYPTPDATYPLIISGLFRVAPPFSDIETTNPWMNEAEELIRARAKKNLYVGWMSDMENAQAMGAVESAAFDDLMAETSRRSSFRQFRSSTL